MSEMEMTGTAPIPERENTKLAMWVFLGGEVVFFVALILLIVFTRMTHRDYEVAFRGHLNIPIIALNTFILVTSSYFVVRALESIGYKGDPKGLRNNLIGVLLLGILFMAGQAYEWIELFHKGVDLTTTYGTSFFTVTGIHGMHVLVGLLWLIYLLFGHRRMPFTQENHLGIENFGLYWHFVDVVWIALFTVIYLI